MDPPFSDILRSLIEASDLPIKHIAEQAGVSYQPLQRWIQGVTEKYDVAAADKVHRFLSAGERKAL